MRTIQKRFLEHIREAARSSERPLYRAINKYGIENFSVEEVEQCSDLNLNDREQYWISVYNTYHNGYNATLGGDGSHYLDYDLICKVYQKVKNRTDTAKQLNICDDTVTKVLLERSIEILDCIEVMKKKTSKPIVQISLTDEEIQSFPSLTAAAEFLISHNLTKGNIAGVKSHIRDVAVGKRKTAYKYKWKFI